MGVGTLFQFNETIFHLYMTKRISILSFVLMMVCLLNAQEVVIRRDTVRDTVYIRETVREYVAVPEEVKTEKKKQPISIKFETRADWENTFNSAVPAGTDEYYNSNFVGKYFNFLLNGNITDKLSYHFTMRLNRCADLNAAIDKACFDYKFNDHWKISAGKSAMAFGGWEYDAAPIDIYYATDYWNTIACFQLGVRGMYTTRDGKSSIVAEISNSPFNDKILSNKYAYSLLWYGNYGPFHSAYSFNMLEYQRGKFMKTATLGNKFLAGPMRIEFDYMWRYCGTGHPFRDFTLVGMIDGNILDWAHIYVKAGYEENLSSECHNLVEYGKQNLFYGIGFEAFPVDKTDFLRLHAYWMQNDVLNNDFTNHKFVIGVTFKLTAFERKAE